jgi:hypothetical protein
MKLSYDEARHDPRRTLVETPAITRIDDPPTLPPLVEQTGSGFFDPENTGEEPGTIHLRRVLRNDSETFLVDGRIGYRDKELGVFLVPNPAKPFDTDLASVPQIFTWLVPKSGEHLPAAILHDGLIPPSQGTYVGPVITRQQADRIFRDGMRDLGTGWIRRWLVWTAVTFATEADEGFNRGAWKTGPGVRILTRLAVFIGTIVMLGIMATIDLFDRAALLPWMGDHRTSAYELLVGGLFALVIPAALSLLFWPRKMIRAAVILGIAMALFLHVTLFILLLLLLYNGAEASISAVHGRGSWNAAVRWFAGLGTVVVGLLVLTKLALTIPRGWGWSFKVPLVQGMAEEIGRVGTWIWDLSGWVYLLPLAGCLWLFFGSRAPKTNPSRGNTKGAAAT